MLISKKKALAVGITATVALGLAIGPANADSKTGNLKLSVSGNQIVVADSGFRATERIGIVANFGLPSAGKIGSRAEDRACGDDDRCTGEDVDGDGAYDYI